MAETNLNSIQIARILAGAIKNLTTDIMGRMRSFMFNFAQGAAAGDIGSTAALVVLPPGGSRLYLLKSLIAFSAFGAARTLDIGHSGYTDRDGNAVAADTAAFVNDLDVSAAGTSALTGVVGSEETFLIESQDQVTILATVAGGTIPIDATLDGYLSVVRD